MRLAIQRLRGGALAASASAALCAWSASAHADSVVPVCSGDACRFALSIGGTEVGHGFLAINPDGTIGLDPLGDTNANVVGKDQFMWMIDPNDPNQNITVGLNGDADPILGFSVSSGTGASGSTFAFSFSLPIALNGTVAANSSVSYSLTSLTSAGADIKPFGTNATIVDAFDVDTDVGGVLDMDKNVDVGARFFFTGGPVTQNSIVYTNNSTLNLTPVYDRMAVLISYTLSANSHVGMSGFVQQVVVPLPATLPLLLSALAGAAGLARRRRGGLAA